MSIIRGRSYESEQDEFEPTAPRADPRTYTYEHHVQRTYGLSPEQYGAMVERQRGRCAICRAQVELHVDHDHEDGQIRGLLCRRCNLTLGYIQDDPDLALLIVDYLKAARALKS